jgi:hypothetical protein
MQYDGTGKLGEAIAGLYGLSPKSRVQVAAHIKKAKAVLGITSKSKNLPDEVKLAIYRWHYEQLNPAQGAGQPTLNGTGAADSLSTSQPLPESDNTPIAAIDAPPIPDQPQHGGNWGGVRQGSGRKPTGKQTVTVRVPVELVGMIEEAKRTGLDDYSQLAARVHELEKALAKTLSAL